MKRTNVHTDRRPAAASAEPPAADSPAAGGAVEQPAAGAAAAAAEALLPVEPATITPEQLKELKDQAARASENWDRLLRTTADFDNFKKRAAREKQEAIKYANEALMQKLVPVLD